MNWILFYTLGAPSFVGSLLLINYYFWRYRALDHSFQSCLEGWIWFMMTSAAGEGLAHLFYPSAYEDLNSNSAQIFGFLLALILSPFLSFAGWAVTRKAVQIKLKSQQRDKASAANDLPTAA